MRYYQRFSLLSVLAAVSLADLVTPLPSLWDDMQVKHTWNAVPVVWESLGPPPTDATIDLHVALKPQHEDALIDALYEVSSPRHPKYGAHLSKEGVAKLVAPHPHTLELVSFWLEHHGVPPSSISTTHGGNWLTLTSVPVSQANKLLGASYQLYRDAGPGTNNTVILRTVGYSLPTVLHTHVQTVAPTTYFASESTRTLLQTPRRRSVGAAPVLAREASRELAPVLSRRDGTMTPSQLRWLYRTYAYTPAATDQNVVGVVGYLNQYPSQADLTKFTNRFYTEANAATFTVERVNGGGYDPSHPGLEANLDIQYTEVMSYPTPHIFYSIGGNEDWLPGSNIPAAGDMYLETLNYILRQPNVPQTMSVSYGIRERDIPLEYATALCNLFAQLGARGVSVLFSSGDDGVGKGDCKADDGSGGARFIPVFPASCPWVTSVGGTRSQFPEVAASLSGGGFSFHFRRPRYQDDAVLTFLKNFGNGYRGLYNPAGRGIPDISAQAWNFVAVSDNKFYILNGTSCAAPLTANIQTVAGIISLLNDFLLSEGEAPLGFLNPWLYGSGLAGLNDITHGTNPGCNTDGFSAIAGWDPVTGLGTPDFVELQYILQLREERMGG